MRWLFTRRPPAPLEPSSDDGATAGPDPDHAWKALALVNEWIRHSDAKAGITLAFTGVLSTMTFNLAKDFEARSLTFDALVVLACALLVLTGGLCGWTLMPRVDDKDADRDAINRLFFASVSQNFRGKREQYVGAFQTLTADPVELTRDLADQIYANARIATIKAKFAKWAMRSAFVAGATVAALAIIIGIANT